MAQPGEGRSAGEPAQGGFDRAEALERVGGDEQLLRELAQLLLAESPGWLAEVRAAIAVGDVARLQRAAHIIKGAVGTFGARAAYEAALRLEQMGRSEDLSGAEEAYRVLEGAVHSLRSALAGLVSGGDDQQCSASGS